VKVFMSLLTFMTSYNVNLKNKKWLYLTPFRYWNELERKNKWSKILSDIILSNKCERRIYVKVNQSWKISSTISFKLCLQDSFYSILSHTQSLSLSVSLTLSLSLLSLLLLPILSFSQTLKYTYKNTTHYLNLRKQIQTV